MPASSLMPKVKMRPFDPNAAHLYEQRKLRSQGKTSRTQHGGLSPRMAWEIRYGKYSELSIRSAAKAVGIGKTSLWQIRSGKLYPNLNPDRRP